MSLYTLQRGGQTVGGGAGGAPLSVSGDGDYYHNVIQNGAGEGSGPSQQGSGIDQFGQGGPGTANAYSQGLSNQGASWMGNAANDPSKGQFGGALGADQANLTADQAAQRNNLQQLWLQSQGKGPNPAVDQIQRGLAQSLAQQQSLGASATGAGSGGALALRSAAGQQATLAQNAGNATAQVNAQQRAAALSSYNQAASQYMQQGLGAQANAQAYGSGYGQLQGDQNALNAQLQEQWQQQAQNVQYGQLSSQTGLDVAGQNIATQGALANNAANAGANSSLVGAFTSALGQGAAGYNSAQGAQGQSSSDARGKDDVRPAGARPGGETLADKFMEHLHPYSYRYKDPANEPTGGSAPTGGRYMGVMAQDVERAPEVGRQIVKDTPRGKQLSVPATVSALAAGVGRLHERLAALESQRAGKNGGRDG